MVRKEFELRLSRSRFADAKEVRDRLQRAGCEPGVLLASVEVYCRDVAAKRNARPLDSYIQEFLEANVSIVTEAEKLAKDLEKNANRIEQLNRAPEILRELTWSTEDRSPSLPSNLRSYAAWLKNTAKKIRSPYLLRDQPGQIMRFALDYIKKMTGRGRISDLAKLVRVGYAIVGLDEDVDENSLDRVVRRARQRTKNGGKMKKKIK
jgi:hypothetical protein